jgi:hypothetical protein
MLLASLAVSTFATLAGVAAVDSCAVVPTTERRLAPGQADSAIIIGSEPRNRTGIVLDSGGVYTFRSHGEWKDGSLPPTTADGRHVWQPWWGTLTMTLGWPFKRKRLAKWFELTGELPADSKKLFRIGAHRADWTSPRSGQLVAFANDWSGRYHNNKGCVTLVITRVR